VPYTVQGHDCRGIFAATVVRVHVIGGRITRAAVATMMMGDQARKGGCGPGFSSAPSQTAAFRCSSAAIAIGATSTAPTVDPARVGGLCMQRGGAIRRAVAVGSDMRRDRAATGRAKIK
jgi:hypothetical protein